MQSSDFFFFFKIRHAVLSIIMHAMCVVWTHLQLHECRSRATVECSERSDAMAAAKRGTAGTRGTVTASSVGAAW